MSVKPEEIISLMREHGYNGHASKFRKMAERIKAEGISPPEGFVLVKVEPDPALLASMAMRRRHDFGLLPQKDREYMVHEMSQVHEEVVGRGFYQPSNREEYVSMYQNEDPLSRGPDCGQ